jgi:hypothetical protein
MNMYKMRCLVLFDSHNRRIATIRGNFLFDADNRKMITVRGAHISMPTKKNCLTFRHTTINRRWAGWYAICGTLVLFHSINFKYLL